MSNYLELYFDTLKKSSDFRLLLIPVSFQEKKNTKIKQNKKTPLTYIIILNHKSSHVF